MPNFSNLTHPPQTHAADIARARAWMRRNWQRYIDDGLLDQEALAEQAAYEFEIDPTTAAELAAELAKEIN